MHPNPIFRNTERQTALEFAKQRGFGILSINSEIGPLLAHVPFFIDGDDTFADLHLVKSNPIAREIHNDSAKAIIAINGPDSYVSPDWYDLADQVPTWNYIAVHLRGTLTPLPNPDLKNILDKQSAHFEERLNHKTPWTAEKMSEGALDRMMRAISPFRFTIEDVQSTFKLNQNKPTDARESAANGIEKHGIGLEPENLAFWMRKALSDS